MRIEGLVVDVHQALFATAESASYEGIFEIDAIDMGPDVYTPEGPFEWSALLTNVGGAILVSGTVAGSVYTDCARCLEKASFDVEGEIEGYFIIPGQGEAPEDMDEDEFDELPEDNRLDLEPLVMAGIVIDLPLVPLCSEDCKGLCSQCGANLNEGPCGCTHDEEETISASNPFAVLKNIEFEQ